MAYYILDGGKKNNGGRGDGGRGDCGKGDGGKLNVVDDNIDKFKDEYPEIMKKLISKS